MAGYDSELTYLDGPRFYDWLAKTMGFDVLHELRALKPNIGRRLLEYKNGRPAHIDAVDRIMVALHSHISLIPDDCWIEKPKPKAPVIVTDAERRTAVLRFHAGESRRDIANELGVKTRTVENWCRAYDKNGNKLKSIRSRLNATR
jgi:hypothetical protein